MIRPFVLLLCCSTILLCQQTPRPVPPPGVEITAAERTQLETGLAKLAGQIARLGQHPLLPDIQVFHRAVAIALEHKEFFKPDEVAKARDLLAEGSSRADALLNGRAPWTTATGLVVRGYVSDIDGTVQPYALVVPASYDPKLPRAWRLDAWFHGRNETLSEVNFLSERMTRVGEFAPADTLVLHLYGRYCNANKFAGEVDLFEALAEVKRHYRIDENRIAMRGFSMGGAAAWHFAAHHAGLWAAAAPGAGFAETAEFLKLTEEAKAALPWYEKKLWAWYDATLYAANLYNLPTVAYSGEIDGQIQAAKIMERYLAKEKLPMTHVIGPQTPHRYHPDSKKVIDAKLDAIMVAGREAYPRSLRFVTYTLHYPRMKWLHVDGLAKHWEKATIDAHTLTPGKVVAKTSGVTALTLQFGPGGAPTELMGDATVELDGQALQVPGPSTDRSWTASFHKEGARWMVGALSAEGLRKRHGLQGPIDDAFLTSFAFVLPSGPGAESFKPMWEQAAKEWRRHYRGEVRMLKDTDVTAEQAKQHNLVLWGDPQSNAYLAKVGGKLPIAWPKDSAQYLAMIYPNPESPSRYVLLNSGFTFQPLDYLNNARQTAKLPDWAVMEKATGKVVDANFFDEKWAVAPKNTNK